MICGNCGSYIADGQTNCPGCGAPVMGNVNANMGMPEQGMNAAPNMGMPQQGFQQMGYAQPGLTKGQFYKHPNMAQCRKEIRGCGIAMYILAGLNLVIMFGLAALGQGFWTIIDVMLILALGLIIHLAQSRVASIILTVYGTFNVIYMIITTGKFSGYLFLIVGICAIIYTFRFQKAWKEYQRTGVVPLMQSKKK